MWCGYWFCKIRQLSLNKQGNKKKTCGLVLQFWLAATATSWMPLKDWTRSFLSTSSSKGKPPECRLHFVRCFFGQKGWKRWVAFLTVPKRLKWQINIYISSRPPASRGGDLLICSRAGLGGINNTGNIANMFDEIPQTFRIRVHHKDFLPAELIHTQF